MEYHASCGFDSVKVYDNAGSNKTLLGSFCGFDIPPPLQSTTSKMTVIFTSDYVMQFVGFNVTVEFTNTKGKYVVFSCGISYRNFVEKNFLVEVICLGKRM